MSAEKSTRHNFKSPSLKDFLTAIRGTKSPSLKDFLTAIRGMNDTCLAVQRKADRCATNDQNLLSCKSPDTTPEPEACITFRRPMPLLSIKAQSPKAGKNQGQAQSFLSRCVPVSVDDIRVTLALDLLFEQSWYFQDVVISGLVSTIALAPGEVLRLSVRSSQRKLLTRSTLDEVDQTDSTEATIVDRDVMNVTRSSSNTNNWQVSGNASISIPLGDDVNLDLGASGGMSGSATRTANSASDHVNESTQKSSTNLRNMHKVEVTETSETVEAQDHSRRIANPYRDRSLWLKIYALAKEFCVDFALRSTRPSLLIEITDFDLDQAFVQANADFLDKYLIDRRLALELPDALEAVSDPTPLSTTEELNTLAALALKYLFSEPNIFSVGKVGGWNANTPQSSFNASGSNSGLNDAVTNRLGIIFTTLNYFYAMYQNEAQGGGELATQIALAIEEALYPQWFGVDETGAISNVLDTNDRTEGFRRLGGFLAFVSGTIRPLLRPSQDEQARNQASGRAQFVIARVVEHLGCHKTYYIARYLEYLSDSTRGASLLEFVKDVLQFFPGLAEVEDEFGQFFAPELAFVDRCTIVVPGLCVYPPDASNKFVAHIDGKRAAELPFGTMRVTRTLVPTEGAYLEPTSGRCRLEDLPAAGETTKVELSTDPEPVEVRVTNATR